MRLQTECPKNFKTHIYIKKFIIDKKHIERSWDKLQRRETFVDSQFFPFRVEFDSLNQFGQFEEGELNIHHGPLMSFHGAIGECSNSYRDLKYFFGSYFISFRIVRPVRLEFFKNESSIELKLTSFVHPLFLPFWKIGNKVFWSLTKLF